MLEKTVKAAVRKRLKEIGAYQFWPVQMGLGIRTVDCIGCYRGRFFGIETKAPGKKPTLAQDYTMKLMRAAGALVFVIDSPEQANDLFRDRIESPQAAVGPLYRRD
jgi:penicillin-binding protein-related factor A (putative recombinase)